MSPRWRVVEVLSDGTERLSACQSEAKAREVFAKIQPFKDAYWPSGLTAQVRLQCHKTVGFTPGLRERKYWSTVELKP